MIGRPARQTKTLRYPRVGIGKEPWREGRPWYWVSQAIERSPGVLQQGLHPATTPSAAAPTEAIPSLQKQPPQRLGTLNVATGGGTACPGAPLAEPRRTPSAKEEPGRGRPQLRVVASRASPPRDMQPPLRDRCTYSCCAVHRRGGHRHHRRRRTRRLRRSSTCYRAPSPPRRHVSLLSLVYFKKPWLNGFAP